MVGPKTDGGQQGKETERRHEPAAAEQDGERDGRDDEGHGQGDRVAPSTRPEPMELTYEAGIIGEQQQLYPREAALFGVAQHGSSSFRRRLIGDEGVPDVGARVVARRGRYGSAALTKIPESHSSMDRCGRRGR
jgi:hypothetical protein